MQLGVDSTYSDVKLSELIWHNVRKMQKCFGLQSLQNNSLAK